MIWGKKNAFFTKQFEKFVFQLKLFFIQSEVKRLNTDLISEQSIMKDLKNYLSDPYQILSSTRNVLKYWDT